MLITFLKVTPTQNRLAYPFCGDLAALQLQAVMSGLVCEIHFLLLLKYLLFSFRRCLLEAGSLIRSAAASVSPTLWSQFEYVYLLFLVAKTFSIAFQIIST